jgi:hypothetical protein
LTDKHPRQKQFGGGIQKGDLDQDCLEIGAAEVCPAINLQLYFKQTLHLLLEKRRRTLMSKFSQIDRENTHMSAIKFFISGFMISCFTIYKSLPAATEYNTYIQGREGDFVALINFFPLFSQCLIDSIFIIQAGSN